MMKGKRMLKSKVSFILMKITLGASVLGVIFYYGYNLLKDKEAGRLKNSSVFYYVEKKETEVPKMDIKEVLNHLVALKNRISKSSKLYHFEFKGESVIPLPDDEIKELKEKKTIHPAVRNIPLIEKKYYDAAVDYLKKGKSGPFIDLLLSDAFGSFLTYGEYKKWLLRKSRWEQIFEKEKKISKQIVKKQKFYNFNREISIGVKKRQVNDNSLTIVDTLEIEDNFPIVDMDFIKKTYGEYYQLSMIGENIVFSLSNSAKIYNKNKKNEDLSFSNEKCSIISFRPHIDLMGTTYSDLSIECDRFNFVDNPVIQKPLPYENPTKMSQVFRNIKARNRNLKEIFKKLYAPNFEYVYPKSHSIKVHPNEDYDKSIINIKVEFDPIDVLTKNYRINKNDPFIQSLTPNKFVEYMRMFNEFYLPEDFSKCGILLPNSDTILLTRPNIEGNLFEENQSIISMLIEAYSRLPYCELMSLLENFYMYTERTKRWDSSVLRKSLRYNLNEGLIIAKKLSPKNQLNEESIVIKLDEIYASEFKSKVKFTVVQNDGKNSINSITNDYRNKITKAISLFQTYLNLKSYYSAVKQTLKNNKKNVWIIDDLFRESLSQEEKEEYEAAKKKTKRRIEKTKNQLRGLKIFGNRPTGLLNGELNKMRIVGVEYIVNEAKTRGIYRITVNVNNTSNVQILFDAGDRNKNIDSISSFWDKVPPCFYPLSVHVAISQKGHLPMYLNDEFPNSISRLQNADLDTISDRIFFKRNFSSLHDEVKRTIDIVRKFMTSRKEEPRSFDYSFYFMVSTNGADTTVSVGRSTDSVLFGYGTGGPTLSKYGQTLIYDDVRRNLKRISGPNINPDPNKYPGIDYQDTLVPDTILNMKMPLLDSIITLPKISLSLPVQKDLLLLGVKGIEVSNDGSICYWYDKKREPIVDTEKILKYISFFMGSPGGVFVKDLVHMEVDNELKGENVKIVEIALSRKEALSRTVFNKFEYLNSTYRHRDMKHLGNKYKSTIIKPQSTGFVTAGFANLIISGLNNIADPKIKLGEWIMHTQEEYCPFDKDDNPFKYSSKAIWIGDKLYVPSGNLRAIPRRLYTAPAPTYVTGIDVDFFYKVDQDYVEKLKEAGIECEYRSISYYSPLVPNITTKKEHELQFSPFDSVRQDEKGYDEYVKKMKLLQEGLKDGSYLLINPLNNMEFEKMIESQIERN